MKKVIVTMLLILSVIPLWAKSPLSFTLFSLDETRTSVEKTLETEFKGRFTTDEWGGIELDPGKGMTVYIGIEEDRVIFISVTHTGEKFSEYNDLVARICRKYDDPDGITTDEDGIMTYWHADDYSFDHRVILNTAGAYSWTELVFYGK